MGLEDKYIGFLKKFPGVEDPVHRLDFRAKLKWTGAILLLYFALAQIRVFGIPADYESRFQFLEIILGSSFGSFMTLGIGPIVTASIILQLLVGSKVIPWDLTTDKGKILFQGTQKFLAVVFSFIEAGAYVLLGAIPAATPALAWAVILQLAMGGILVIFMDELISKWGFGSGVSLFIVAGVSKTIIIRMFNPLTQSGALPSPGTPPAGVIPYMITAAGSGDLLSAFFAFFPVISTILVFLLVVYTEAIKVEIPLAFGSIRGFGRRWPLKFFYTSNIPVILIAALLANIQLMGRIFAQKGATWIAKIDSQGNIIGGLLYYVTVPRSEALSGLMTSIGIFVFLGIVVAYFAKRNAIKTCILFALLGGVFWFSFVSLLGLTSLATITTTDILRMIGYSLVMIGGSMVFSVFWVETAGMNAHSVAQQIHSTGMQIPGYRRDIRIIESVLERYIPPLAVLGGAAVGFLAAFADFTNALGTGTGILLATMIIYSLYEELTIQHLEDMHPAVRRLLGR